MSTEEPMQVTAAESGEIVENIFCIFSASRYHSLFTDLVYLAQDTFKE